jgi:hypothetical protein
MRRLLPPLVIVPVLMLLLVAPAAAAPPYRESGTQEYLLAVSTACGGSTCTDTVVDAFTIDSETLIVCVSEYTYNVRNGRLTSERNGCTDTSPELLTVTSGFDASLSEVAVPLCGPRSCDEVSVAADLQYAGGPIYSDSSRGSFSDGTCTYRYSSSGESADAYGTISLDGTTADAFGSVGTSEYRVTERCRG